MSTNKYSTTGMAIEFEGDIEFQFDKRPDDIFSINLHEALGDLYFDNKKFLDDGGRLEVDIDEFWVKYLKHPRPPRPEERTELLKALANLSKIIVYMTQLSAKRKATHNKSFGNLINIKADYTVSNVTGQVLKGTFTLLEPPYVFQALSGRGCKNVRRIGPHTAEARIKGSKRNNTAAFKNLMIDQVLRMADSRETQLKTLRYSIVYWKNELERLNNPELPEMNEPNEYSNFNSTVRFLDKMMEHTFTNRNRDSKNQAKRAGQVICEAMEKDGLISGWKYDENYVEVRTGKIRPAFIFDFSDKDNEILALIEEVSALSTKYENSVQKILNNLNFA